MTEEERRAREAEVSRLDGCEHDWFSSGGMCCAKCRRSMMSFLIEVLHPELPRDTYKDELKERMDKVMLPKIGEQWMGCDPGAPEGYWSVSFMSLGGDTSVDEEQLNEMIDKLSYRRYFTLSSFRVLPATDEPDQPTIVEGKG